MNSSFPKVLFTALLRLYPRGVRDRRSTELECLYQEMWEEMAPRGLVGGLAFRVRMAMDLLRNMGPAWGGNEVDGRGAPSGKWSSVLEGFSVVLAEGKVAVRRLLGTPGFTLIAIVTLALGIAANVVVFTLIHGVYLEPLPFLDPHRVVYLREASDEVRLASSFDAYRYFADEISSLEALGAYSGTSLVLQEGEYPERLKATRVSANLFSILGSQPTRGRGFSEEEDEPGSPSVVVLSHATWQNRFNGREDIVGSQMRISGGVSSVVGVMPPDFYFPNETIECWVSLSGQVRDPTYRSLTMVGRLTSGSSMEIAGEEVMGIGRRLEEENEAAKGGEFTHIYPLKDLLVGRNYKSIFLALAVAVTFLLLIAGANLTNLLLARASTRKAEYAVRSALGASRRRAVLTGVSEPLVLSVGSGVLGVVVAYWATEMILRLGPENIPRQAEIGLSPGIILFALGLSLLAGGLIGLASLSRKQMGGLSSGIHTGSRVSRGQPLLSFFTVTQVALTFALLAGVSLMAKTVQNLQAVDVGFEPERAYAVNLRLSASQYPDAASRLAFHDLVLDEVRTLPWVSSAGYVSFLPLEGSWSDTDVRFEGGTTDPEEFPTVEYDLASPGFFAAMGISLRGGRVFDEGDRTGATPVVVVNEALCRAHFPDGNALGQRLATWDSSEGGPQWLTVVGVVEDVPHHDLKEAPTPKFYVPFTQFEEDWPFGLNLVIRTGESRRGGSARRIREAVGGLSAESPLVEIVPLRAELDRFLEGPRFNTLLLGVFTLAALGLATLGLYGVVAFGVTERRKEIGLRMAMGADGFRIQRETLWRGLRLTLVGVLAGVPLALLMGRVLASMLFGVASFDPRLMVWVTVLLAVVATTACVLPSLKASRTPPATALKAD